MIEILLVVCFVAVTGYCLVVMWPRLDWSLRTLRQPGGLRPQYRADRPDLHSRRR